MYTCRLREHSKSLQVTGFNLMGKDYLFNFQLKNKTSQASSLTLGHSFIKELKETLGFAGNSNKICYLLFSLNFKGWGDSR